MKNLLSIFSLLISVFAFSQGANTTTINVVKNSSGGTWQALLTSPYNYAANPTKRYPLIMFGHGAGQATSTLSSIYTSSSAGGPAYFINQGTWPVSFKDPLTGDSMQFFVVSPQAAGSGWSITAQEIDFMLKDLIVTKGYRIDSTRLYVTGLSAGGDAILRYTAHLPNDNGVTITNPRFKFAAAVPMSQAGGAVTQTMGNQIVADSTWHWGFGSPATDIHGENTEMLISRVNTAKSGFGIFTNYSGGHCCWGTFYNPTYRQTINGQSMNIYEWMLTKKRTLSGTQPPTVTITGGSPQTVTLPTSSISVAVSATAGGGSIISYAWTRLSGPNTPTLSGASTNTLSIGATGTAMIAGAYSYQCVVTQTDGQSSTVSVTINVLNSNPPVASAGSNQNVTNQTTLNLSGSGTPASGRSITAYLWSLVSGPNTPTITSATSASTTVTSAIVGTYVFKLKVTQSDSQVDSSNVTIVNAPATPVANAGPDQTITLPTSSVTLSGSASTGTITTYAWTRVSGPNTPTFGSSTSVSTTVGASGTALIAGTYVFRLTLNGGSTDDVTVTVNATAANGCPSNKKIFVDPGYLGDLIIGRQYQDINSNLWTGGDTLVFSSNKVYRDVQMDHLYGTSESCPIVIINSGGQVTFRSSRLVNSKYIKFTGTGAAGVTYGFKSQLDPVYILPIGGVAFSGEGKTSNVHYDHLYAYNHNVGFYIKTEPNPPCDDSLQYPSLVMDSISVDSCMIIKIKHEGMYIGSTAPDNGAGYFDPRPVDCAANGVISYPRAGRMGNIRVTNNYIDSTGRGGIQLASASKDTSLIAYNIIKHAGMSGIDNQGTGISVGSYTRAYIHNNTIINTMTWGIASLGGSGTDIPLRIEDNYIDSIGYLYTWNDINDALDTVKPNTPVFGPGTIGADNFACGIFAKTAPLTDVDSTRLWIKNNRIGLQWSNSTGSKIQIQDGYSTLQVNGNIICNNTGITGTTNIVPGYDLTSARTFSTNCGTVVNVPPTAQAFQNQTIQVGATANLSGNGNDTDGAITGFSWTKISGDASGTITTPTLPTTTVTGLNIGKHIYRLTVTDNFGATGYADVTIRVQGNITNQLRIFKTQ